MIDAQKDALATEPTSIPVMVMFAKSFLLLVALGAVACSGSEQPSAAGGAAGSAGSSGGGSATGGAAAGGAAAGGAAAGGAAAGDESLFFPAGITVTQRLGNNSMFNVIALTLRPQADGSVDLYAAVRNDGDTLGCNASFSAELQDQDEQALVSDIRGLMVRRFYRFNDGSDTVAGCVAPGDVTMVTIPNLTLDPPTAVVRRVVYQSSYWGNLDLSPIAGVSLSDVQSVARSTGLAYTGALHNGLDRELANPTVAVFALNSVGRPLAVAYGASPEVLPPGGKWDFETSAIEPGAVAFDAYPMGGS